MKSISWLLFVIIVFLVYQGCEEANPNEPEILKNWEGHTGLNEAYLNKIIFATDRAVSTSLSPTLHIMNSNGSEISCLTKNNFAFFAAWSPNKWKILFVGYENYNNKNYSLFITDYNGENVIKISKQNQAIYGTPAWSLDGQKIAFIEQDTSDEYSRRIIVSNPDGSEQNIVTNWMSHIRKVSFDNSSKVYFDVMIDGKMKIYNVPKNGGTINLVIERNNDCYSPAISPNGKYIAFASSGYANGELSTKIFLYNFDTKKTIQMNNVLAFEGSPSWTIDGNDLVFEFSKIINNYLISSLAKISVSSREITLLTDSLGTDYNPCAFK